MDLKLDMNEFNDYAKKLGKLHRSALPTAVRATLNTAAFDVKKNTLIKSAKKAFEERDKNFFKANSTVDMATGWNVDTMKSSVGMMENRLKDNSTNHSVQDLEQQEHGGTIKSKSFIPMRGARTSKNSKKKVSARFRMSQVLDESKYFSTSKSTGKTNKAKFVRTAIYAFKKNPSNAYILGNVWKGNRTLSKIESIKFNRDRTIKIKRTPLYTYRKGRSITVAGKNFMKRAAHESSLDMNKVFRKEAERQFKKYLG